MVNKEQVQYIAKLARLELSEKELEKMQKELAVILDYVNLLKEIDISKINPTSHSISLENVMREDEVREEAPDTINKILEQAPAKEKGYIRVKGILK